MHNLTHREQAERLAQRATAVLERALAAARHGGLDEYLTIHLDEWSADTVYLGYRGDAPDIAAAQGDRLPPYPAVYLANIATPVYGHPFEPQSDYVLVYTPQGDEQPIP